MGTSDPGDRAAPKRTRRRDAAPSYQDLGRIERSSREVAPRAPRRKGLTLLGLVVTVSVVAASALALFFHYHSDLAAVAPWTPARYAVVFVVSGAGPEILHMPHTRNIAALQRQGTVYGDAWAGQTELAPVTSGATLGTGAYPWAHGVVGPVWRDPPSGRVDRTAQADQVRFGSLDRLMGARHLSSLAALLKQQDPAARVLAVGGAGCVESSAAGTWAADYVLCPARRHGAWQPANVAGHGLPANDPSASGTTVPVAAGPGLGPGVEGWNLGEEDRWIGAQAVLAMRSAHPRLTVVDFPELATVARWAPASRRQALLQQVITGIDRQIGDIVAETQREKTFGRTVFALTSDGAVSPLAATVPRAALDEAILAAGGQTVYLQADGSAMIGLRDPLQAQPVAQVIQGQQLPGVNAIYYKRQTGSSWGYAEQNRSGRMPASAMPAISYLLWTMASPESPDVVVAYAPHTGTPRPRDARYRQTGVSLGMGWDQQHIPLVIAGHEVFPGRSSRFPARLVDVAPTLETLMGLTTGSQNGVPLADAMIQPPEGAAGQQMKTARWLSPLVAGLKRWESSAG